MKAPEHLITSLDHAMVDVEALDFKPGGVILSVGAVLFNPYCPELGGEFYANIDVDSCLRAGLTVDGRTFYWWLKQADLAKLRLMDPKPEPLRDVLSGFARFLEPVRFLWSHGSNGDIPLLASAYEATGRKGWVPWKWKWTRDTRTLFSLVPYERVRQSTLAEGLKHDALDDSIRQARQVINCYNYLRAHGIAPPELQDFSRQS